MDTTLESTLRMASTESSTTVHIPEEYARIFKEAYHLRIPSYDFKACDAFLFSRCSDTKQVLGLFMMFD